MCRGEGLVLCEQTSPTEIPFGTPVVVKRNDVRLQLSRVHVTDGIMPAEQLDAHISNEGANDFRVFRV